MRAWYTVSYREKSLLFSVNLLKFRFLAFLLSLNCFAYIYIPYRGKKWWGKVTKILRGWWNFSPSKRFSRNSGKVCCFILFKLRDVRFKNFYRVSHKAYSSLKRHIGKSNRWIYVTLISFERERSNLNFGVSFIKFE